LDVLRDLRLLPLRLALRPLWPPLCHPRLRPPGFDPPRRFGISRRCVESVLGGIGLEFLITGSFGAGLGYNTELFPTQIRGTAVGAAFTFGQAGGALAPLILGWIATS